MQLPIFYSPNMQSNPTSFSPSAVKPALVVAAWQQQLPVEIIEPVPVTIDQLALAHDRGFVEGVLDGRVANGFGDCSREVAASLPHTTGAMLAAARYAIAHGRIACAPCSGFHHARYAAAGGFCTFNGLVVTACVLREDGVARRVGILDCDMHDGDGTADIIARLDARRWITHFSTGAHYDEPADAGAFFEALPGVLESMRDCDVVLYQAGADAHVDDPLGGWLTTEQLRRRDAIVFDVLRELGVPVAWNLAGGYQRATDGSIPVVIEIHTNTAREALRADSHGDAHRPALCKVTRRAFDAQLTPALLCEVTEHARRECGRSGGALTWLGAEDLVHTAIVKTLDGRLHWDPARDTLAYHLKGAIDGELSHALLHVRRFPRVSMDAHADGDPIVAQLALAQTRDHQAEHAAARARDAVIAKLRVAACGHVGVQTLLAAYAEGACTRAEVLAMTGMSRVEYETAHRRLLFLTRRFHRALRRLA